VAVLFDECNLLSRRAVLLEMLRNVFMNTPGYMLVFTGTPDLFPVMDEVFSPIVRQFKKIEVTPFQDQEDIRQCLRKPLESIKLDAEQVFDPDTYSDLTTLQGITGGRPHEIQLLCHFMFKKLQLGQSTKMQLSLDIFDAVLRELSTGHDISTHPIVSTVRQLNDRELRALGWLCSCQGSAGFEQLWFVEFVLHGEARWRRDELEGFLSVFERRGLISSDRGIRFKGDYFEMAYSKYYAAHRRLFVEFEEAPYEFFVNHRLGRHLARRGGVRPFRQRRYRLVSETGRILDVDFPLDLSPPFELLPEGFEGSWDLRDTFSQVDIGSDIARIRGVDDAKDLFDALPSIREDLYWCLFEHARKGLATVRIVSFRATTAWGKHEVAGYVLPGKAEVYARLVSSLPDLTARARALGGDIELECTELKASSSCDLEAAVVACSDETFRIALSEQHSTRMKGAYFDDDMEEARMHAAVVLAFQPAVRGKEANNIGYLFLACGDLEKAAAYLQTAEDTADAVHAALARYNLATIHLKQGRLEMARELLLTLTTVEPGADFELLCVFVPHVVEGRLEIQEDRSITLPAAVRQALASIDQFEAQ